MFQTAGASKVIERRDGVSSSERRRSPETTILTVQSEPPIRDPREFETIVKTSLQAIFGEWEPYSCGIQIVKKKKNHPKDSSSSSSETGVHQLQCPTSSVGPVRCALAMITPPSYLDATLYRLDVVSLE